MIKCNYKTHILKIKGSEIDISTEVARIIYECIDVFGEEKTNLFIKSAKDEYQRRQNKKPKLNIQKYELNGKDNKSLKNQVKQLELPKEVEEFIINEIIK